MLIAGWKSRGEMGWVLLTMTQMLVGSVREWRLRSNGVAEEAWEWCTDGLREELGPAVGVVPVVADAAQPPTSGRTSSVATSALTPG
jgi:hypothetical protein